MPHLRPCATAVDEPAKAIYGQPIFSVSLLAEAQTDYMAQNGVGCDLGYVQIGQTIANGLMSKLAGGGSLSIASKFPSITFLQLILDLADCRRADDRADGSTVRCRSFG